MQTADETKRYLTSCASDFWQQFIADYRTALQRTAAVLRPGGRLIALLLNPVSTFFRERYANSESYIRKLKHTDLVAIETTASEWFETSGEYYPGINGGRLFESSDPAEAALYIIQAGKLLP